MRPSFKERPGCCSIRISPGPSLPGCWTACRTSRAGRARRARVRNGRQLSAVAAHRRQSARHRRHQCVAHATVRHSPGRWDDRTVGAARRAQNGFAGRAGLLRRVRHDRSRICSAAPFRSAASPATSRRRSSARPVSRPAWSKSTYGTGCFALLNTGRTPVASQNKLLTTIAYQLGGVRSYALEGSIFIAGAAVQWLRDNLHVVQSAEETGSARRSRRSDPRGRAGAGLRRPRRALLAAGCARRAVRADARHRAARIGASGAGERLFSDRRSARRDASGLARRAALKTLRVDGGMANSDLTMQRLADLVDCTVDRPQIGKPRRSAPPISPACTPDFSPSRTALPSIGNCNAASRRTWIRPCANANSPHGKPPSHGCSEAGGARINLNFATARRAADALINNSQRHLQLPDMAAVEFFIPASDGTG